LLLALVKGDARRGIYINSLSYIDIRFSVKG